MIHNADDARFELQQFLARPAPREVAPDIRDAAFKRYGYTRSAIGRILVNLFALGLAVVVFLFFPWQLPVELAVKAGWLQPATARIIATEKTRASEGGGKSGGRRKPGKPVFAVRFSFTSGSGDTVEAVNYFTGEPRFPNAENGRVEVEYFPLFPKSALLRGGRLSLFSASSVLILVFPVVFLVLYLASRRGRKSIVRLLADGEQARATVVGFRTRRRGKHGASRIATLSFPHPDRETMATFQAQQRDIAMMLERCCDTETPVRILYLPEDPTDILPLWPDAPAEYS